MATYSWMLDKFGNEYPVEVHYYVNEFFDLIESAVDGAAFIIKSNSNKKTASMFFINLIIAYQLKEEEIENDDIVQAIKELYKEDLEYYGIEKPMAIYCYNRTKPYNNYDEMVEFVDSTTLGEAAEDVAEELNEGFARVRIGGMIDSDNVAGGEIVYRISSHGFDWYNTIYSDIYKNKTKYKLKSVTICRDAESDYGIDYQGETKFYKNKRGQQYIKVPIQEFLSEEFESNPCFEKLFKGGKKLKESLDDFDGLAVEETAETDKDFFKRYFTDLGFTVNKITPVYANFIVKCKEGSYLVDPERYEQKYNYKNDSEWIYLGEEAFNNATYHICTTATHPEWAEIYKQKKEEYYGG